jgi:hypothetical protein
VRVMLTGTTTEEVVVEIVAAGETAFTVVCAAAVPTDAALRNTMDRSPIVPRIMVRRVDVLKGVSR